MRNILYGVCGIGLGHTFRQLPMLNHFVENDNVVIFGYGRSSEFYREHFKDADNVSVQDVAVPFIVGNKNGLDFAASATHPANVGKDFTTPNLKAMAAAIDKLGQPDLVVTDYEPNSAQVAYATGAPLVTIDQQSKYLIGDFPKELASQGYADEQMRLRMFFPQADKRIACSFFDVTGKGDVMMVGPVIREAVTQMTPSRISLLVYLSSQQEVPQSYQSIVDAVGNVEMPVDVYFKDGFSGAVPENVRVHKHGDGTFDAALESAAGIVTTAGHTLLSEAMHLGTPVYAIALPVYEQQMNATVVGENGFGVFEDAVTSEAVQGFVGGLPKYAANIANNRKVLLREPSQGRIIDSLENLLR